MKNHVFLALVAAASIATISGPSTPSALAETIKAVDHLEPSRGISVKVSAESISKMMNMSIQDSRTIADWVSGTFVRGTTLTNATASLRVRPDDDRAAIDIVIDSETTADTVGYNQPIPSIGIDVSFSSHTRAQTIKTVYIDANSGILVTPAYSAATTAMTIHNVDAWAGGLFKRLKRRIAISAAWRKLLQEKANQEVMISNRVSGELNAMADAKAKELLHPVNIAFKKYFIQGFLKKNRLPGRIIAQTNEGGAWLTAWAPQSLIPIADPHLNDPARSELSVHLNGAILSHVFETLLGGVEFTSGEMAEIVAFANGFSAPVPRNNFLRIHLREKNPIEFAFHNGSLTVRITTTKVTLEDGNEEPGAIVEVAFSVTREGGDTIHIKREGKVAVFPLPPAQRPSSTVVRAIDYYFNDDNGKKMDKKIKLGHLPGSLAKLGSLELLGLDLKDGWMLIETKLNPASSVAEQSERVK